jgi:hypothetical protein
MVANFHDKKIFFLLIYAYINYINYYTYKYNYRLYIYIYIYKESSNNNIF